MVHHHPTLSISHHVFPNFICSCFRHENIHFIQMVIFMIFMLKHTCDISLFRRELPIFCLFLRKSPYENFQNFLYILYISLFGISDLPTKTQEFPSLFNHSPYLGKKISLFVFWDISHVWLKSNPICKYYL